MKKSAWIALLAVVALMFVVCTTYNVPAHSASKHKVRKFNQIAESSVTVQATVPRIAAAQQCRTATASYTAGNVYGNALMAWNESAQWCYDGTKIVGAVQWNTWGSVGGQVLNVWDYTGHGDTVSASAGNTWAYQRAYGHFQACIVWFCWHRTPYVALTVRGDGTYAIGKTA